MTKTPPPPKPEPRLLPTPSAQEPGYTGELVDADGVAVSHAAQRTFDPKTGRLVQTGLSQAIALLPTPAVNDMGANKTVDEWDEWTARMKSEHGNGNGHGPSLSIEALRLLPTPSVADVTGTHERRGGTRSDELLLPGVAKELSLLPTPRSNRGASNTETASLLPTPQTSDTNGAGAHGTGGNDLRTEVSLLPTPMVGSTSEASHGQISGQYRDQMAAALDRWGDYAPAIHRWEQILGRSAPEPTRPSPKTGRPQLAAEFVEWLMGVPAGWVTDTPDLTRNEALKALGNGVVPQQAAEAVRRTFAVLRGAA